MNHRKISLVLLFCLLPLHTSGWASDTRAGNHRHRSAGPTCPKCHSCCELKVEKVEEDRYCWEVETKQICVPRVVFPWQKKGCDPTVNNGAYIKTVRVPKKHDFTCPTCKYSWTPKERVRVQVSACGDACDCDQCLGEPAGNPAEFAPTAMDPAPSAMLLPAPVVARMPLGR